MTREELLQEIKALIHDYPCNYPSEVRSCLKDCREYLEKEQDRDLETEPIKDTYARSGMGYEYHDWLCPNCRRFVAFEPNIVGIPRRCQNCGQLLKRPEVERE